MIIGLTQRIYWHTFSIGTADIKSVWALSTFAWLDFQAIRVFLSSVLVINNCDCSSTSCWSVVLRRACVIVYRISLILNSYYNFNALIIRECIIVNAAFALSIWHVVIFTDWVYDQTLIFWSIKSILAQCTYFIHLVNDFTICYF